MTQIDRIADLSQLWRQVSTVFPYFGRVELDWDETYRDYLPKVLTAENETEFHLLLAEFLNLLGDGHTDYAFPRRLAEERGYLPFALRYIQGEYYVSGIIRQGRSHLLCRVTGMNGRPFGEVLGEAFRYLYHVENFASSSRLERILPFLLMPQGNVLETSAGAFRFDLAREKPELVRPEEPGITRPYRPMGQGKLDIRLYEGKILYARMDDCLYSRASEELAQALEQAGEIKGVILDLRENIGGMTAFGGHVAELFIPGEFHGSRKWTRLIKGIELSSASQVVRMSPAELAQVSGRAEKEELERCRKIVGNVYFEDYQDTYGGPDHEALFSGPCVILTSRNTVSAAEDTVAFFRSSRRAALVGTPTQGTTGTPLLMSLSCGGRARVCSVGYRLLDGTEFIRSGIQPDIWAENSPEDLKNGFDRVLEQGIRLIEKE